MNYYRCKCGKREAWSSYGPFRCKPCPECGTTLGRDADDHLPVEPHQWEEWKWEIDAASGVRFQTRYCSACMTEEKRMEQDALPASPSPRTEESKP